MVNLLLLVVVLHEILIEKMYVAEELTRKVFRENVLV